MLFTHPLVPCYRQQYRMTCFFPDFSLLFFPPHLLTPIRDWLSRVGVFRLARFTSPSPRAMCNERSDPVHTRPREIVTCAATIEDAGIDDVRRRGAGGGRRRGGG